MPDEVFMADFWFKWTPALYAAKTQHLTLEEDAIYRRLIDHYMLTGKPIMDNDMAIQRITGATPEQWYSAKPNIFPFFHAEMGFLKHQHCEEVLKEYGAKMKKAVNAGKAGAEKRWKNTASQTSDNKQIYSNPIATPIGDPIADKIREEEIREDKKEVSKGIVKGMNDLLSGEKSPSSPPKIFYDFSGMVWKNLSDKQIQFWTEAYPAIDVEAQLTKAAAWLDANPKNRKQDYKRFLQTWLARSQDKAPRTGSAESSHGESYAERDARQIKEIRNKIIAERTKQ